MCFSIASSEILHPDLAVSKRLAPDSSSLICFSLAHERSRGGRKLGRKGGRGLSLTFHCFCVQEFGLAAATDQPRVLFERREGQPPARSSRHSYRSAHPIRRQPPGAVPPSIWLVRVVQVSSDISMAIIAPGSCAREDFHLVCT
jgi:hypothetical protein